MAEKSEKATPKKLRDARKKGQVAKSQDFPAAFTFAASILLLVAFAGHLYDKIGAFFITMFEAAPHTDLKSSIAEISTTLLWLILEVTLPIAGLTALVGVIVSYLMVGPLLATEAMKPDIKRLNPINGLKQKFKMKTLVELIKQLLKIVIAGFLVYRVLWQALPTLIQTAGVPLIESAYIVAAAFQKVAIQVGVFFLAVTLFDLVYQRRVFAKEMKMEKFEVKQEYKDLEGDPQIKQRRRQLAQEVAYEEGPTAAKRARVVVTNPIHIAVAVGYQPDKYAAPYILVMGVDQVADQIMRVAGDSNVPIMRDPALAQELFEEGAPNQYIPEGTYDAVAEILRWVIALEEELE